MAAMQELVGQTLGKYQIERLLGEGGMGAVYLARHRTLQMTAAVKVMHPHYARQPDFRQRFLQEAQTAAKLDHPGIVKVRDFDEAQGFLYIVMEFIPGDNLQQLLQKLYDQKRWLPLAEAIHLIRQVALALDYAHRLGILHRDIKPANIMLKVDAEKRGRLQPIITDLGLAKLNEGGLSTQADITLGTPAYMSPEQAQAQPVDARSDVYSLGILLYELAVGRRPFPIKSLTEAIRYHSYEKAPPPRTLRPELPVVVEQVILRAMEKDPNRRFPTALGLAQALAAIPLTDLPAGAPTTAPSGPFSLTTQVQESIVAQRGPSVLQEFPRLTVLERAAVAQLQVLAPDGSTQLVTMPKGRITVGREVGNEVVLKENKVSRRHLQIDYDGVQATITDLDSANGTLLGGRALLPATPTVWPADSAIQIGKYYLRQVSAPVTVAGSTEQYVDVPVRPPAAPTEPLLPSAPSPRRRMPAWATVALTLLLAVVAVGLGGIFVNYGGLWTPTPTAPAVSLAATATPAPAEATPLPPTTVVALPTDTPLPAPPTDTPVPPTPTPLPPDTPTAAPPPTDTPQPVFTPTDTPVPALPTSTPILPSPTPVPTDTPVPPTKTPIPPTATPPPPTNTPVVVVPPPTFTPTPRPNGGGGRFRVTVERICDGERGYTWFKGTVFVNGQPANGYIVAWYSRRGSDTYRVLSGPHAERPGWAPGYYEHLGQTDKFVVRAWRAFIADANGNPISDFGDWDSDGPNGPCNRAIINFYG